MINRKILIPLLIFFLLFSVLVLGTPNFVDIGPTTEFTGDVGVPDSGAYYIGEHRLDMGVLSEWTFTHLEDQLFFGAEYTNLTEFVGQTTWRVFYSNTDGDVTELALGAAGTYLGSTGVSSAPIFDTPSGAGDMLKATYDTDADGDIDVASGGTEKSSWTLYAIPYLSGTTVFGEIPIGTDNYALTVNGVTGYDWTHLQIYDAGLSSLAELTYASDSFIKVTATDTYAIRTLSEVRTDLGLVIGTNIQAFDVGLTSLAGLTYVSPSFIKATTADTYAIRTLAEVKTDLSLNSVENTALSTWAGTTNITTLGTIGTGTWEGTAIADAYVPNDITIDLATLATTFTVIDNESEALNCSLVFVDGATGAQGAETDGGDFYYNPSTGTLTAPQFAGVKNYYSALESDHTYSANADVDSQPVGENVAFGDILYKDWATGEWMKAQADAFATTPGLRIALETKGDGDTCLMLIKGYIRDDSAFDFGASRVFLNDDVAGTCDDTAPAESGDQIQIIGTAISADILFFDPGEDVGEI